MLSSLHDKHTPYHAGTSTHSGEHDSFEQLHKTITTGGMGTRWCIWPSGRGWLFEITQRHPHGIRWIPTGLARLLCLDTGIITTKPTKPSNAFSMEGGGNVQILVTCSLSRADGPHRSHKKRPQSHKVQVSGKQHYKEEVGNSKGPSCVYQSNTSVSTSSKLNLDTTFRLTPIVPEFFNSW